MHPFRFTHWYHRLKSLFWNDLQTKFSFRQTYGYEDGVRDLYADASSLRNLVQTSPAHVHIENEWKRVEFQNAVSCPK